MDMNCTSQYIIDPVSNKRLEGKGFVSAAVICRDFLTSVTTPWAFTVGLSGTVAHERITCDGKQEAVRRRNKNCKTTLLWNQDRFDDRWEERARV